MLNAYAINTVALNAAPPPEPEVVNDGTCQITTRTVKRAPGTLNAAVLNGAAVNAPTYAVDETTTTGFKQTTTSRTPGTLSGLRLNAAPLNAGITRVVEVCVPGCVYTIRTVTRGPGTFNGMTLNASALNAATSTVSIEEKVGRREVVTERKPGTLNLATLNGVTLNGGSFRRVERCVPIEDCVTETRRRPGGLNMQALNRGTLNGTSYYNVTVCGPAQDCYTETRRKPGGVNTFALNRGTLNGTSTYSVTVCVDAEPDEPHVPQQYYDTLVDAASALDTLTGTLFTLVDEGATGSVAIEDAQIVTLEARAQALVELDTLAAQSSTFEALAQASAELIQSRGSSETLERAAAGSLTLTGSRGQYDSILRSGTATGAVTLSSRGYTDLFELVGAAYGEITRAGDTSFESIEETLAGAVELTATRRVFEPTLERVATATDEVAGLLGAVQWLTDQATASDELEAAFLRVIRDTIEALGAATGGVTSSQLHAVTWFEILGRAQDHLRPTPLGEAWVFNTRTLAMSRYVGTGVSQVVDADDGVLAATNEGLASQDPERSREATVKWGVTDYGSQQLKGLRHVYFTAAGGKALKVRTRHGYGEALQETLYERPLSDTAVPTVYRVDMARGPRAPMWGFELIADADTNATVLDQRVLMLIESRRF